MSATTDIGSKIKKYRKEKKYTLKNLSEQTGLSIGFLSQLERGITTIAIDSLANVADVLGVEMMDFFESDLHQENDPVMRSYADTSAVGGADRVLPGKRIVCAAS